MFGIQFFLAGLGHVIAHWSEGLIVIAACGVAFVCIGAITAYLPFLAPFTSRIEIGLAAIALGTALVLGGEWIGARDANDRNAARQVVVEKKVDSVVKGTTTPTARDQKDPFDNPDN